MTMAEKTTAKATGTGKLVHLRIKRQDGPGKDDTIRWEEFKVPYLPLMNVNSALQQIQKDPVTTAGKTRAVEAFFRANLSDPKFRAAYTTPVKSLSNDKLREFREMFGAKCSYATRW